MAKARPISVSADEPFASAAERIVHGRAEEVFEHSEGVLDTEDIERVHAMRVATRRLRAVLEIFAPAFGRKEHRRLLKEVKALADALGARRDPDVHIVAIERMLSDAAPEHRAGLELLREEWRRRQAEGNETLAEALHRAEETGLRDRLLALRAEQQEEIVQGEVVAEEPEREAPSYPFDDSAPGVRWIES